MKKILIIAASDNKNLESGGGGINVLTGLRSQLSYLGMDIVGRQVIATMAKELKEDDLKAVSKLILR